MLDKSFPTPDQYNSIRHFGVQTHRILPVFLQGIGEILVKYRMYLRFGAFLLHRYSELRAGSVIVQTSPDLETEICRIEPLEDNGP